MWARNLFEYTIRNWKIIALVVAIVGAVGIAVFIEKFPQDPQYHLFADQRSFFNIPNCFNTISNLPCSLAGLLGLCLLANKGSKGYLPSLRRAYILFFLGGCIGGIGSAYYHYNPCNFTLVFDRLPMTVAFMSFFSIVVGEHINESLGKQLVWPLIIFGIFSVLYWRITDNNDGGDLHLYGLVQYLSIILIFLIALMYRSVLQPTRYLWGVLLAYGAAKLFEVLDLAIFQLGHVVSGHTLKHIAAALSVFCFCLAISKRHDVSASPHPHNLETLNVAQ